MQTEKKVSENNDIFIFNEKKFFYKQNDIHFFYIHKIRV